MGKSNIVKSLAKCIGNVVMHKLLILYTNRDESKQHLKAEIIEYGEDAFEKAQEFNWNKNDKEDIKKKALERVLNLVKKYPDVQYKKEDLDNLINETIEELML